MPERRTEMPQGGIQESPAWGAAAELNEAGGVPGPYRDREPIDKHLERLTFILDRAIRVPGTQIRVGLDPILGLLLPGAGDVISTGVSAYIIAVSVRYGLPKGVVARMVLNVLVDFAAGSIPLVGDVFDFAWRANSRNMRLLNRYASGEKRSLWSDWAWLFILLGGMLFLVSGLIVAVFFGIKALI